MKSPVAYQLQEPMIIQTFVYHLKFIVEHFIFDRKVDIFKQKSQICYKMSQLPGIICMVNSMILEKIM